MNTINGIEIPKYAIGTMNLVSSLYSSDVNIDDSTTLLHYCINEGYVHLDTADCYPGNDQYETNEHFLGQVLNQCIQTEIIQREDLFISTKCGIVVGNSTKFSRVVNNSPSYIWDSCQNSLMRMKLSYIDLFYIHRFDLKMYSIFDSIDAMYKLKKEGYIRYIGLSECNLNTIQKAHQRLLELSDGMFGLDAVQSEYNLLTRSPERNDIFSYCADQGIKFVAYSPLARGLLSNQLPPFRQGDCRVSMERFQGTNLSHNMQLCETITKLAAQANTSASVLAIKWIENQAKKHNITIYPILGTTKLERLKEILSNSELTINENIFRKLNQYFYLGSSKGKRYPDVDYIDFDLY